MSILNFDNSMLPGEVAGTGTDFKSTQFICLNLLNLVKQVKPFKQAELFSWELFFFFLIILVTALSVSPGSY